MKCPKCKHEWEPRAAAKRETRRAIEDRAIDRELGLIEDEPSHAIGADELGGMRGAIPGLRLTGHGAGSDDYNDEDFLT